MPARRSHDESLINSIVGPGTFFRGHLELDGLLRIDGDYSGSVRTSGRVIVGQSGRADCAIEAGTVVIGGLFRGEILAHEKVVLLASSLVIGSITAPRLVAEDGVVLSARFRVTGSAEGLVPQGDPAARRKELLLESMRTRERSDSRSERAAAGAPTGEAPARADERVGAHGTEVPVAPGNGTQWNA